MVIVFMALLCAVAAAQTPCWPLDMPTRYLTGNFMEPRDGRYHAGLDLKTNSRTGYPVLAAEDGHISRLRISATGYGQAVYLTTKSGTTYVYGHLGRLRDDLRRTAAALQEARGSYELDRWFAAHEWPVEHGEVLALSGQSATLGPHLHFEVRGPDGQLLDPLAHGFAVPDVIAPQILAVRAVRGPGVEAPSLLLSDGRQPLTGRLPDLRIDEGPLFFSALIIERSDLQNHLLGPWRLSLTVDGKEVFCVVNDSLRWDNAHHQLLEFNRTALGKEQWLRLDERNRLSGRRAEAWLSEGRWPAGRHHLELAAEDRAGNRSSVFWTLAFAETPRAAADAESSPEVCAFEAAAGRTSKSAIAPGWRPDVDVLRDRWLVDTDCPGLVSGTLDDSGLAWATAPLHTSVPERFWRLSGLEQIGRPVQYRLESDWALLREVPVVFPEEALPARVRTDDPELGVYRLGRNAWVYAGSLSALPAGPGHVLRQPGVYQVMRDRWPPIIATATVPTRLQRRPVEVRAGITMPRWPVLAIPVGDHGSGVDWSSLQARLDGKPLIVEPDPPRDRVLVELPADLEPGVRLLVISVRDRAGHRAGAELALTLGDPASQETTEASPVE